jgi:hypothetical protein
MITVLVWCIVGYLADCGVQEEAKALRFPKEVALNNYVKLSSAISKPMTALSVCTWLKKFLDPREHHIFFSYAVSNRYNEIMMSDWKDQWIGNKEQLQANELILLKNEWYHVCLTWSASTRRMDYYVNGVHVETKSNGASSIGSGGILIVGQEQDSLGGGFDITQAFGGDLYQMNVFSRKLLVEDVAAMYYDGKCSKLPSSLVHDIVISWKDILGAPRSGAVHETSAECGARTGRTILDKMTKLVLQELSNSD